MAISSLPSPRRDLFWDGCVNVRDLGGLATEDGGETRFGAVIRADSVRQLTDDGWAALVDYGVGRIVDLRWHDELAQDPPRELPVALVHVPVFPDLGDPAWERIEGFGDRTLEYLGLLEWGPDRFAQAVSAIARAGPAAVVVHCAAGRDRTGLVSALLLRLAGVGVETIVADFETSERNLAPLRQPWLDEAPDEQERARRLYLLQLPELGRVLTELERRHGSAAEYLRGGGAGEEELAAVRARLRG